MYHRFLWRDNLSAKGPSDFQWKRLPFGDCPAPNLSISALHFLADKHSQEFSVATRMIKHHSYVDDLASSFSNDQDAFIAKRDGNDILATASFEIKGWHSNSHEVDEYPSEMTATVLGHHWDKLSDMLKPKLPIVTISESTTKRIILSSISRLWDQLGIFSPISLKLRLLMQSLWALKLSWDEQADNETKSTFLSLSNELKALQEFQISRSLRPVEILKEAELHGFCDGDELAYGAVIWLRWQIPDGVFLRFVAAKSFVAPVKRKSIPRLELLGALVLASLVSTSVEDLDEEPFTGNTLIFPHGQPTVLQPQEHGVHDLRLSIKAAQTFINVFLDSWMRNMPPQLLLVKTTVNVSKLNVNVSKLVNDC